MKKAKLLFLLSTALLLTGCNAEKDDKDNNKTSEASSQTSQCVQENVSVTQADFGTEDDPLTVSAMIATLDKVDHCKSGNKYTNYKFYVYGTCTSNTAQTSTYKDFNFINLEDEDGAKLTVMWALLDDGVTGFDGSQDCFKDCVLAVSGYGQWYNKNGSWIAELVKKDNDNKPVIYYADGGAEADPAAVSDFETMYQSVFGEAPTEDDYFVNDLGGVSSYDEEFASPVGETNEAKGSYIVNQVAAHLPTGYVVERDWGYDTVFQGDSTLYYDIDYHNSDESLFICIYSYLKTSDSKWYYWFEAYNAAQYDSMFS
ncbi:MAG: hypothetical protein K6E11_04095 [Bacilli bacterium]|nr:hypothetical protein [Bacilli bacterium]